jgi:hypothetical protein
MRSSGLRVLVLLLAACSSDPAGAPVPDADIGGPDGGVVLKPGDGEGTPDATGEPLDANDGRETPDAAADSSGAPEDAGGFNYPCEPLTVESCVTACASAGKHKCLKEWGPCIPPEEFCGNCADDDCDGQVNEGCAPNPECEGPPPTCPVATITVAEAPPYYTGTTLHLSASESSSPNGAITQWSWSVQPPAGSLSQFKPGPTVEAPSFLLDASGQYLFTLVVWDAEGQECCSPALLAVSVDTYPPMPPENGCSDGTREGFLDQVQYPHIAGCAGGWAEPGVTPDEVKQTCGGKAGNDSSNPQGKGCSTPDLCAAGWHVCRGFEEVALKSPTGCAGSTPPDAKPKSLFFAMRQPSFNGSACEGWDKLAQKAFNDVFGCGNLGTGLGPDKKCGPLDRVLASTQPDSCGFNEAEPPLGPWECKGGQDSHLNEGKLVTKKACAGESCSYDGYPVGSEDKGGVLCCRD